MFDNLLLSIIMDFVEHLDCVEVLIKHGAQLSERDCQHFISSV